MVRNLVLLLALGAPLIAHGQDPWPLQRHDRWGSGRATLGPAPATATPWILYDIITNTPVSCGPSIGADGIGYYGDWVANNVYKFNVATGQILNTFQALNFVDCTPALSNGQIFVSTSNPSGRFFAIDTAGFDYNWFAAVGYTGGSPIVGPDGNVIVGLQTGSMVKYNAVNGNIIWQTPGGTAEGTPALTRDDQYVLFANGSHLTALNYATGAVVWDDTLNGTTDAPGVADSGTIICSTQAGTVYALDPGSGATLWSYTTLEGIDSGPAFSPDGLSAYVTGLDHRLYSFNVGTGQRNWSFTAGQFITTSPTVGADGSIYFSDYNGNLYRISSAGSEMWVQAIAGQPRGPITIGPDGTLYMGYTGSNISGMIAISQQLVAEPITSFSMYRGSVVSGDITSLQAIDGNQLVMAIGPTLNRAESPCQVTLTANLPYAAPASFTIALNSAVTSANITQNVLVYNNATSNWDVIDSRPATTTNTSISLPISSAQNYWNSSTKNILIRVQYTQTGPTLQSHWEAKIDYAQVVNITPQFKQ